MTWKSFNDNSKMNETKTAQASIFMIIGALVVASALITFYFISIDSEPDNAQNYARTLEALPTQFKPVADFIETCAAQKTQEAITRIGEHGGYLSLSDPEFRTRTFTVKSDATESEAIQFPRSRVAVPYWWYLSSPNICVGTCTFSSARPSMEEIELSIERYVERTLNECIADLRTFSQQGFEVTSSFTPDASVNVGPQSVTTTIDYPVSLRRDGTSGEIDGVVVVNNVALGDAYDLATEITNLQMQYRFFERHALNLLVAYSGLREDRLPPFTELTFDPGTTIEWSKTDVHEKVQRMISSHSQLFQVERTGNFDRPLFTNDLQQHLYDDTLIPNAKPFHSLTTGFAYLDFWPVYFDLNCNGDSCRPASANTLIKGFGLQEYRFAYDLSYPMLIDITDPSAFEGEGFTLRFAIEANIRNNKVLPAEFAPLQKAAVSRDRSSLLCTTGNRNSGDVSIVVRTPGGKKVSDAQVMYTILGETCYLGVTDEQGELTTTFPSGTAGGVVAVTSPTIVGTVQEFTPTAQTAAVHITASELTEVNAVVEQKKVEKVGEDWFFRRTGTNLQENQEVLLAFNRVAQDGQEQYSTIARYEPGKEMRVRLAPGTYDVDFTLLIHERVVIPPTEQIITTGLTETETITYPGIDFGEGQSKPQYQQGGFIGQITIPESLLDGERTIVFYVVAPDIPETLEDASQSQNIEYYSEVYGRVLQPTFRNE